MPQRTNAFQKLVFLIQKAMAPAGAKVTESALDENGREIDVLIESHLGPYRIKVAVEAKDEGRKMDSTTFESLMGRYFVPGGVQVNKVVLVTHQGYYEPVIQRAKMLGVDLLTLQQALSAQWADLLPQSFNIRMEPHLCEVTIIPPVSNEEIKKIRKEGCVYSDGTALGT